LNDRLWPSFYAEVEDRRINARTMPQSTDSRAVSDEKSLSVPELASEIREILAADNDVASRPSSLAGAGLRLELWLTTVVDGNGLQPGTPQIGIHIGMSTGHS